MKKRTPRVPVSYSYKKDDRINYTSLNDKSRESEVDANDVEVEHVAALALTEASQRGGSPQVSQTPYRTTEHGKSSPVLSWDKTVFDIYVYVFCYVASVFPTKILFYNKEYVLFLVHVNSFQSWRQLMPKSMMFLHLKTDLRVEQEVRSLKMVFLLEIKVQCIWKVLVQLKFTERGKRSTERE